jgi:hypothetical protein
MTARPAARAVRLSADKLLVHIQSVHQYLTKFPDGEPVGDGP